MKLLLLVFTMASIALATPVPEDNEQPVKEYARFIDYPNPEGNLHRVDLEAEPDMDVSNDLKRNPNNNVYLLFTRRNKHQPQTLTINDASSILNSNFDPNVPTTVLVHDWLESRHSDANSVIRIAFLNKSVFNVIIVCWRDLAARDYVTAATGVPAIGRGIGQFITFLVSVTRARLTDFHLIGSGLGAHVVGNAGKELGGKPARVTGLNPAGPLWNQSPYRLGSSDGVYVEAIHTDAVLGIGSPVADADFFTNSLPGCVISPCNYIRAWELFAASVTYDNVIGRECTLGLPFNVINCRGEELHMGNADLRKTGRGIYFVVTRRGYPYSIYQSLRLKRYYTEM